MSMVQNIIRDAERHAAECQRMFDSASFQGLIRNLERHTAIAQSVLDAIPGAQAGIERTRRFAKICIQLKWPPPWHMPSRLVDRITAAHDAGKLTQEETAGIFASFYTPERIEEFGQRWTTYGELAHRLPILQEALGNHIAGRHYSAVCVLLPQIEGVLREAGFGPKLEPADIDKMIGSDPLATAVGEFYIEVLREPFTPGSTAAIPDLSRHAVLHGIAIDYGTPMHSLKVILMADIILSSIEETRNQSAQCEPPENEQ